MAGPYKRVAPYKRRTPTCHPARVHEAHGLCRRCYQNSQWASNPKHRKRAYARLKARGAAGTRAGKDCWLRLFYGISHDDYDALLEYQKGCCAICRRHQSEFSRQLAVDHNHNTGRIRGLLCGYCNTALGQLEKVGVEHIPDMVDYIATSGVNLEPLYQTKAQGKPDGRLKAKVPPSF